MQLVHIPYILSVLCVYSLYVCFLYYILVYIPDILSVLQDCVLIENMHDRPYLNGHVGPEVIASMTAVCGEVKRTFPDIPFGVQILAG